MPSLDSTLSTLSSIRTKIRRLTRSPSTSQLTDEQIEDYVNTFILYDFPEFTVDNKLVFFLSPNIDFYETNTIDEDSPLFNFKNVYLSVQNPVYVAGEEIEFSQSREQFYRMYPKRTTTEVIGTGDGVTAAFAGTLSYAPSLARTVSFSSIDDEGAAVVLKDVPLVDAVTGIDLLEGDLVEPNSNVVDGDINYLTGVYNFTFDTAPAAGEEVVAQMYVYATGIPRAVMFEDNTFTFRPVPDKTYRVEIDAFRRPTELLDGTDTPDLAQWWQYIAYGAAKKVFEDRMDVESVRAITPEFLRQRTLVLQRLIVQQSSERTATIYTNGGGGRNVDGNFF